MDSDLVERLRGAPVDGYGALVALLDEAADRLEALQADKTRLRWEGMRWEFANGRTLDEQRANLSQSLRYTGDCRLIWVNEGDLMIAALQETER